MNLSRNFMNLWGKKVVFIHSKFLKSMLLSSKQLCVTICSSLTHFSSNFHFSTPYKCQNAYGFLAFLWGAEMEHWQWFPYFESIIYNHFCNILRPFDVLTNFSFTTSETMHDYYLWPWYIQVALRVPGWFNT